MQGFLAELPCKVRAFARATTRAASADEHLWLSERQRDLHVIVLERWPIDVQARAIQSVRLCHRFPILGYCSRHVADGTRRFIRRNIEEGCVLEEGLNTGLCT